MTTRETTGLLPRIGETPMGGTPEEVTSYIASESARWSDVVRTANIKMD